MRNKYNDTVTISVVTNNVDVSENSKYLKKQKQNMIIGSDMLLEYVCNNERNVTYKTISIN